MVVATGLNLSALHGEVAELVRRTPHFRAAVAGGYDADDLLSEVFVGLLVRQRGRGAWDPARGNARQYCWGVSRSVVIERTRIAFRTPRAIPLEEAPEGALGGGEHREVTDALQRMVADLGLSARQVAMLERLIDGHSLQSVRREFRVHATWSKGRRVWDELQDLRERVREHLEAP